MLETQPFGFVKSGKIGTIGGKPNMLATDRGFFNKPHSPLGQTQAQTQAHTQTGETGSNLPHFDRQSSRGDSINLI